MGLPAAMIGAWFGDGRPIWIKFVHLPEKRLLYGLVIIEVIERPKHPLRVIAQYHPYSFRQFALDGFQHLRVCAKLDEVIGLNRMRQLNVTDFVKSAFAVRDSEQKIGESDQRDQFEACLINDVLACHYSFERDSPRFRRVFALHSENLLARVLQ